jgi:hypothetical protein
MLTVRDLFVASVGLAPQDRHVYRNMAASSGS